MVFSKVQRRAPKLRSKSRFGHKVGLLCALWIAVLASQALLSRAFAPPPKASSSLAEMVGQLIIVGFEGDTSAAPGFLELMSDLQSGLVGGVIFMSHNIRSRESLVAMTDKIKRCKCKFKPFIAIDEEGGKVERLTSRAGFHTSHSAAATGLLGDEKEITKEFDQIAGDVSAAGFNLNLAPVVDIDINPENPIIGALGRSYSGDPEVVYRLARLFIERHHRHGILTSVKHFPGHGSSSADTHVGHADVTRSWSEAELIPYRLLILDGQLDMIMVGHVSNAKWKGPASLAPSDALTSLLRKELRYSGVIISDDLDMDALTLSNTSFDATLKRAVIAGNDILLVSNHHSKRELVAHQIHNALMRYLSDNSIDPRRIRESFDRVQELKGRFASD